MKELLERLSIKILSGQEVAEILGNPKDFPADVVEKISIETALQYWNGKIDFDDGDCIMNNLQSFWVTNKHFFRNFEFGKISWDFFEAFDAGEYIRPTDNPEIDPAEIHTKPQIERLLKELKLIE